MVKNIVPLGDIHNGKRTELVETDKIKYIKKPRDCKTEVAFSAFIDGLSSLGFERFSRAPRILESYPDYHTEEVEENLPSDERGIERYYYRAGILLFVCYLFSSSDLHCENIIAVGDMPILVDMETLLSGKNARSPKLYNLAKSALCSHLLANFINDEGRAIDVSGISGITADLKNIPRTVERNFFVWEKQDILIRGFEYAYKFFLNNKSEVEKLLGIFDNCEFRKILRPTSVYNSISKFLSKKNDEERKPNAERILARAFERDIDKERLAKSKLILETEIESVLKNEIPLFYCKGNGKSLFSGGKVVFENFLELSPVEFSKQRLFELCDSDLERQKKIILLSISASTPISFNKPFNININSPADGEICAKIVTESQIFDLPSIFTELSSGTNGVPSFVSSGFSLYSGLAGILCMYASLYRKTEKREYIENLEKCYEKLFENVLNKNKPTKLNIVNGSLGDGILGILSCLIHISELIGEKRYFEDARMFAERLYIENIESIDYLNGLGALPIIFGKLGIDFDKNMFNGFIKNFETPLTTGVAHGSSGLALTMLGLGADIDILKKLLEWENQNFSEPDKNWFDLRDKNNIGFMSGWCGGAPGIGMARLYIKDHTDNEDIKQLCEKDIERAKHFLSTAKPSKRDSLCCGRASRIMAGSRLGIELDEQYNGLCEAEKRGALRFLHPADTADINVSLMQGFSGVAYALAMYGDPLNGGMLI